MLRTSFLYVLSITDEMLQDLNIDTVYYAVTKLFTAVTAYVPKYKVHGGTPSSNLALQSIQARLRMVLSYFFAQLLPTVRCQNAENPENKSPGGLLGLGSAYAASPFIK